MADADAVLPFTWRELSDGSLILDDKADGCHPANLYERRLIAALIAETERAERLHQALAETTDALESAMTWAEDSDDPDGDGAARHFAQVAKRARAAIDAAIDRAREQGGNDRG